MLSNCSSVSVVWAKITLSYRYDSINWYRNQHPSQTTEADVRWSIWIRKVTRHKRKDGSPFRSLTSNKKQSVRFDLLPFFKPVNKTLIVYRLQPCLARSNELSPTTACSPKTDVTTKGSKCTKTHFFCFKLAEISAKPFHSANLAAFRQIFCGFFQFWWCLFPLVQLLRLHKAKIGNDRCELSNMTCQSRTKLQQWIEMKVFRQVSVKTWCMHVDERALFTCHGNENSRYFSP